MKFNTHPDDREYIPSSYILAGFVAVIIVLGLIIQGCQVSEHNRRLNELEKWKKEVTIDTIYDSTGRERIIRRPKRQFYK